MNFEPQAQLPTEEKMETAAVAEAGGAVQESIDRLKTELALVVRGRKTVADLLNDMIDDLTPVLRTWTQLKQQGFYLNQEDPDCLQRVIDQKTVKITELRRQIAALEA
jgi:Fe-S-cluster formation regulator IscX/YfhJ